MTTDIRAALQRLTIMSANELDMPRQWAHSRATWDDAIAAARAALIAEPVGEGPILQWTENMPPNEGCRYDHCTAETPFGRFLISWKGWKQFDSPTVDETPWGDWYRAFKSVDAAKAACQKEMDERITRWGRPAVPVALPPNYIDPEHQGADLKLLEAFYGACNAEGGTADEIHLRGIRAVLAARPAAPALPVEGERPSDEEIILQAGKFLAYSDAHMGDPAHWEGSDADLLAFARAVLLQQQAAPAPVEVPVAVSDRLPEPNTKVLAYYLNDLGNGRTICAIWVPAKTRVSDSDIEEDLEYDDETDQFYWPEGWYEQIENWEDFGWVKVNEGEVVYWQPLPKWPAHTIPLPSPATSPNND
jgi:hypothetical protein